MEKFIVYYMERGKKQFDLEYPDNFDVDETVPARFKAGKFFVDAESAKEAFRAFCDRYRSHGWKLYTPQAIILRGVVISGISVSSELDTRHRFGFMLTEHFCEIAENAQTWWR